MYNKLKESYLYMCTTLILHKLIHVHVCTEHVRVLCSTFVSNVAEHKHTVLVVLVQM